MDKSDFVCYFVRGVLFSERLADELPMSRSFLSRVQSFLTELFLQQRSGRDCLLCDPEVMPARLNQPSAPDDVDWLTLARGL
jgi:hypothetical protein